MKFLLNHGYFVTPEGESPSPQPVVWRCFVGRYTKRHRGSWMLDLRVWRVWLNVLRYRGMPTRVTLSWLGGSARWRLA